ncbi:polysaccharide pyruvyl transferase family protein [Brucella anthropi]|uniref:polysaccharide pyruvyl transferase family protein n=1 Tax=Brucella anthropi TaxID=529 RepID=UPI00188BF63B|nr:polysaccharide pyruvyl transferase family protein [Brucella anthropi]QPA25584.1 polysaccharide pyruvyl transferase family protein [Brucella anthropi]
MKIALLGQFGSGNSGNDGSLEAMIELLQSRIPDVELHSICSNPRAITDRYHIAASWHGRLVLRNPLLRKLSKLLGDVPRNVLSIYIMIRTLKRVRWLIIPGTGILDDFQESLLGWPFVVFRWCLIARLLRIKIAFVSIGAGPLHHPHSRWFAKSSLKWASYRSYRDNFTKSFLKSIGVDVESDLVFPDIAFNLKCPLMRQRDATEPMIVGVGVMNYRGWSKTDPNADLISRTYQEKLSRFVISLVGRGFQVRLLTGDIGDQSAVTELVQKIRNAICDDDTVNSRVLVDETSDLHQLMRQIDTTDMIVASRYHNIVCALKMGKPLISIGYNDKNDHLMAGFNQLPFCQRIETLDLERLQEQFERVRQHHDAIKSEIKAANVNFSIRSNEQNHIFLEKIHELSPTSSENALLARTR